MRPRILIAEDDAILALRIQTTVEEMGYVAAGLVATGEDAVRLAEELRPDVVLMDIRLRGEMTGLQAATRIHARSETPIIYLTAYSDEALIEEATLTAPYAYLTKPIRDRDLHASIEMVLYKSRTDRALGHLNRVLRSVRDVNQLITRERDPQRLVEQACEILLRTSGYGFVWVVPSDGASGTPRPRAHAGAAAELLDWPGSLPDAGGETAFARAARAQQPVSARELPDTLGGERRTGGCVAVVPMLHAGRVYGCLCVYVTLRDGFDEDELSLLSELAGDLGFALRAAEDAARRRRAEQALRASEERFRALFESNPSMYFAVDAHGTVLSVNRYGAEQLGYAADDLVGRSVLDVFLAEDRPAVIAQLAACVARASQVAHWEVRKVRRDGSVLWVREAARCVEGPDGRPVVLIVCEDVTDVKRAEEALAESNENWRNLVEYQPTGQVVHRDGRVLYANQASLKMAGAGRPEDLLGREILDFVHPDSRALVAERLQRMPEEGSWGQTTVLRLVRMGGEPVDVEMTSLPVRYLGRPAIQSVFWDVTERRRAEEQLRRAQKLDSVGRLAAGIAHDFNNMLQGILGHTQLLASKLHPADARMQHAEQITTAALRCRDLSQQLLAFSRRQVLELRVVDLRDIVRQIQSLLRGALREDVRLEVAVPKEPCRVKADVGQIEQVLMNLAVNAQDAMPRGGSLRIALVPPGSGEPPPGEDAPADPCVTLVVEDTGCGMDAFIREHAFEPFFTSKPPGEGTGLGLAMVHGIVEQHGGSIQLESEVGAGTTFRICLPVAEEEAQSVLESLGGEIAPGRETILLAEDEPSVRLLARELLARAGYTVLSAADGEQALRVAREHAGPIHLLLTDVVMSILSGPELARQLTHERPAMRVLFMSGHSDDAVARQLAASPGAHCWPVLEKPFTPALLGQRLREVLGSAPGAAPSEGNPAVRRADG